MHAKHQDRHHDGADNDAAMHGFAVFVGDTAHCGMWQTNNAEADQYPKRGHKGWREDILRALRGHQLDVDRLQRLYRMANPPGGVDHAHQQHDRADQHYHALHRVVEHAGAKAAIGGIQRDADPEDQQAGIVRNTGSRLQQAGAADKLDGHGADKGHQQTQAGQPDQQATLIARKQHVIEGDSIIATRKDGEFFPQHAQRQPDGGELDHRQQHPAQAVFIGGAGSADK